MFWSTKPFYLNLRFLTSQSSRGGASRPAISSEVTHTYFCSPIQRSIPVPSEPLRVMLDAHCLIFTAFNESVRRCVSTNFCKSLRFDAAKMSLHRPFYLPFDWRTVLVFYLELRSTRLNSPLFDLDIANAFRMLGND